MTFLITPNAKNHINLTDLELWFVAISHFPWTLTQVEGIKTKSLVFEETSILLTLLKRMVPGATFPDHSHMKI